MSAIAIVSPGYPHTRGGVTDHTERVVRNWRTQRRDVLVLGDIREKSPEATVSDWRTASVSGILLQYVPFLYARRGVSRYAERLVLAAREAGIRTTVFVHEPWVPPTRLPWVVLSPIQRRQLMRLVKVADNVATPVPRWARMLRDDAHLLYVGSTLGEPDSDKVAAIQDPLAAPVVFSPLASGLRWDWIGPAVAAIDAQPPLIVIGAGAEELRREHETRRWWDPSWDCRGRLSGEQVLALLCRSSLVMAPFVDGITGRRTSALAALSAGARLVTSRGHLADGFFTRGPLIAAADRDQFVEAASRAWQSNDDPAERRARLKWYDEHLHSVNLDAKLLALTTGEA